MILNELILKEKLTAAADNDEPICDLEFVGLRSKIITALEESGIIYIKQLITKTRKQILKLKNIGPQYVEEIISSLNQFDLLEDKKTEFINGTERIQQYKNKARFIVR